MSNENKQPDERAAFEESWAKQYPNHGKCAFVPSGVYPDRYATTRVQDGWNMWQARAAAFPNIALYDDMLQALEHVEAVYRLNVVKDDEPSSTLANLQRVIARARAAEPQAKQCPACGGNDADMPCAFPEGGQPGCPRDIRLAHTAVPQPTGASPLYIWFAEDHGRARNGDHYIRAWTADPTKVPALREAIGREPLVYAEQRMSDAARDVLSERARQVNEEGWTPAHDDQHEAGELAAAAGCYAIWGWGGHAYSTKGDEPNPWPWDRKWWKPSTLRRHCVKAAALLLAEIERIDRAQELPEPQAEK